MKIILKSFLVLAMFVCSIGVVLADETGTETSSNAGKQISTYQYTITGVWDELKKWGSIFVLSASGFPATIVTVMNEIYKKYVRSSESTGTIHHV